MSAGKLLKTTAVLFFLSSLFSCSFINLEKVRFSYPISENEMYFSGEYFTIDASYDLERTSFENIISLQENRTTVLLDFEWEGNSKLKIKPHTSWKKGVFYHFELDGTVETTSNGTFSCTEHRHFYYGTSGETLFLEDYTKDELEDDDAITFTFSKPVTQSTFISSFTMSPSFDINIDFSADNKEAYVTPKTKWPVNKIFTWTIAQSVISTDNYTIDEKYTDTISTAVDTEAPELLIVCPIALAGDTFLTTAELATLIDDQAIGFIFSKEMDFASIENNIVFSPTIKGSFYEVEGDKTRFIFRPYTNYELQREYMLTVKNSCKDLAGNELNEDKRFFFTTANNYLEVTSISVNGTDVTNTENAEVTVNDEVIFIVIAFSSEITDRTLAENSITASLLFPLTAGAPKKEAVTWVGNSQMTIKYNTIDHSSTLDYVYKITITGTSSGIKDSSGDYMEDNVCVTFIAR
ncbi:MAG: Ig-like domain-containing protein [Treponema sp.]|nr:Ig-like domain-containing protein [Candidatus Treponema scatequi]